MSALIISNPKLSFLQKITKIKFPSDLVIFYAYVSDNSVPPVSFLDAIVTVNNETLINGIKPLPAHGTPFSGQSWTGGSRVPTLQNIDAYAVFRLSPKRLNFNITFSSANGFTNLGELDIAVATIRGRPKFSRSSGIIAISVTGTKPPGTGLLTQFNNPNGYPLGDQAIFASQQGAVTSSGNSGLVTLSASVNIKTLAVTLTPNGFF